MVPPLLALFAFPALVAILFARFKPVLAMTASILVGYMILPHGQALDLPMLPPINKDFVPAVAALLAMLIIVGRAKTPDPRFLPTWLPRKRLVLVFLAMVPLGYLGMVLTNGDPIVHGPLTLPGLRFYDSAALLVHAAVMLIPFLLARRFLGHPDTHITLLWLLVVAGTVYSFLSLYETRMSPQINLNIYGYFQHEWNQHVRRGGFRPILFLQHGLWVSLFLSTVILSALVLFRTKTDHMRSRYLFLALWVLFALVLTKSLGALMITLLLAPVILFLNVRLQLMVACFVAITVMTYPMLRSAGLVPIDRVSSVAASIDANRALSFEARLQNEKLLLEKAQQRPLFGWGTWGRNRVFDNKGQSLTVPDGYWIITIGVYGWVGYIAVFGLLSSGIIGLVMVSRTIDITPATAGLAVVLAGNMIDLLPNATLTPVTWLLAGALLGRFEHGRIADSAQEAVGVDPPRRLQYSRFGPGREPADPVPGLPRRAETAPARKVGGLDLRRKSRHAVSFRRRLSPTNKR